MRKYFLSMLAMAAMLLTVSCSKDAAVDSVANQSAVSFNISTPELTTRAVGDGTTATNLYWAVYGEDGKILPNISNVEVGKGKQFTLKTNVTVSLVRGKKYSFIFWAENEDGMCSIDWNAKTMTIEPKLANQEGYDAFWAYYELEQPVNGTINETIELYRPFAQLNIGTSDKAAAADAGMAVKETKISVATFNTLDLVNGTTTGSTICTYDFADIAEIEGETFPVAGNSYLSMNYLLVSKSDDAKDPNKNDVLSVVKFEYKDEAGKAYSREFYNIPVKRNWKTNIYGTLLTNEANFKVEIKPAFDGENLEKWDGTEMIEPQMVDGVYHVSVAAHLAWILKNCSKDVNMSLDASIDFGGNQVPMNEYTDGNGNVINGTYRNITIEGNGNTIYNFVDEYTQTRAAGDARIAGLFPNAITATVHDLTISGAKVNAGAGESAYAGVLFGRTYGDIELKGVNIENCSVAGTNKVGGLVGFVAENTIYAYNCHVKNTNVSTNDFTGSEGEEAGLAGGLIGYIASGENEITECTVEGGEFTVTNSRDNADRANSKFIGGIGSAVVNVNGCSVKNVKFNESGVVNYVNHFGDLLGCIRSNSGQLNIDGEPYKTPAQKALEAAFAKGKVTLSEDVVITTPLIVPTGVKVTIDLNGKAIAGVRSGAVIKNEGILEIVGDGTIENTLVNGGATINNSGNLILAGGNIIGAPIAKESGYPSYCITNSGNLTIEDGTSVSADRGCLFLSGTGNTVINGGNLTNNDINDKTAGRSFTSHVVVVGYGANNKLTINGGTFQHLHVKTSGGVVINNWSAVTVDINGGNFSGGNYHGKWDNLSDYGYGSTKTPFAVKGGSFTGIDSNYIAEGYSLMSQDGLFYVVTEGVTKIADTADELIEALENGEGVTLIDDVKIDPAGMSNAYGTTGINVKYGQTVDGGGNTLDIKGAGGTWDSGINTTGGLIKNITITGSFRGIFINHNSTHKEKVVLDNVIIDGTTYTISCDQGSYQGLEATNCTFNGWTSYAATIGEVSFTGCNFGMGNGYAYCRPYAPTTFTNCNFSEGYTMDPRAAVVLENCTLNGVAITAANVSELVTDATKVTVM